MRREGTIDAGGVNHENQTGDNTCFNAGNNVLTDLRGYYVRGERKIEIVSLRGKVEIRPTSGKEWGTSAERENGGSVHRLGKRARWGQRGICPD